MSYKENQRVIWRSGPEVRKSEVMSLYWQQPCEITSPSLLITQGFFTHQFNGRTGWICSKMAQGLTFYSSAFGVDPKKPSEGPSIQCHCTLAGGPTVICGVLLNIVGCIVFSTGPCTEQLLNQHSCEKLEFSTSPPGGR